MACFPKFLPFNQVENRLSPGTELVDMSMILSVIRIPLTRP